MRILLMILLTTQAFLTRVASSQHGCRELVSLGSLGYLSQCGFIDMRPSSHGASYHSNGMEDTMGFVPSVVERYRQLFLPLLRFLLAVLMAPGPQQKDACTQVRLWLHLSICSPCTVPLWLAHIHS